MRRIAIPLVTLFGILLLPTLASAQDQAQLDHGQKVFMDQKCTLCHAIGDTGNAKGPLDGVGSKLTADEIRMWIVDAVEMAKKTGADRKPPMKNFTAIPDNDLEALVAYLASLKS